MNSKVDTYLSELQKWKQELEQLREIVLDCGLIEELKWGTPCYMFQKSNIILLGAFKDFCIISFLKGALLSDTENILTKMGENTQAARVVKFTSVKEIKKLQAILKTYIFEAVEIEKAGLKVEPKKQSEYTIPEELQHQFKLKPDFKKAFDTLTPGRQRGYLLYFSDSKQSKTREARIEKYISRIMKGKGIHDCVCGLSKKMPNCDGSHKFLKSV
ncbi:MAG: hypothetical protein C0448_02630 [Sphingobacteriaceae bacterium]|nr:hypothetical protein [Sphingobacteriaceae bacterium]